MKASVDRADQLKQLRRRIAENWPETETKERALRVLDEMVVEASDEDEAA